MAIEVPSDDDVFVHCAKELLGFVDELVTMGAICEDCVHESTTGADHHSNFFDVVKVGRGGSNGGYLYCFLHKNCYYSASLVTAVKNERIVLSETALY